MTPGHGQDPDHGDSDDEDDIQPADEAGLLKAEPVPAGSMTHDQRSNDQRDEGPGHHGRALHHVHNYPHIAGGGLRWG
jgi:hypothetical protein